MVDKIREYAGYGVHILTFIAYFILLSILEIPPALQFLQYFGIVFFLVGMILLILSIISLTRNKTGDLLQTGGYGIVRHPMYLGAILLFFAMVLFLPHWIMFILVSINIIIIYYFMLTGEEHNIRKFGADYREYMVHVPRMNLVLGLFRWMRKRSK
jgi:protein-S-isoprenylcysteine O-methyltransferase Ste14